jgi:N-acyl-D-aspartate/D-glutamate deacylase
MSDLSLLAYVLLAAPPPVAPLDKVEADVVLQGGTIHDGTGAPGRVGDLAIKGDRIIALGAFRVAGKPRRIDARGLIVAPGFIDLHTHSDFPLQRKATRGSLSYLYQGVTTAVTGNCGFGPADVDAYFRALEKGGVGTNVIHLIPHNAVREKVMKNANRAPAADELKRMEELVEQGMKAGAWGLSTGLIYTPGSFARTDELIALARVSGRYGGLYASHIRDEGVGVLSALDEALRIGQSAEVGVHISHLKASGRRAWGKSVDIVAAIARARKSGQAVSADQYPYIASSTSLAATLIPPRFREGDARDFQARLRDPDVGPLIRKAIETGIKVRNNGASVRIAQYSTQKAWQGKDLATIAKAEKRPAVEIVLEIERHGGAAVVNFGMSEEDVRLIMKQPFVATASDGSSKVPDNSTVPHPRSYGTFPRKIGRYALEEKVITLEHALRSATGLPADILKLSHRGYLRAGWYADVVVFDPSGFRDKATYEKPHQYAEGVRYLFVNGKPVIDGGKATGVLAGRVLRRNGEGRVQPKEN